MSRRILGIDPGLVSTGWGIIDAKANQLSFAACGTIAPKTSLSRRPSACSCCIARLSAIIDTHFPTQAAIEETFEHRERLLHAQAGPGARRA